MIRIKPSHKGLLHKALGIPAGQPISAAKEQKAAASASPTLRKQAQFARTARTFTH